MPPPAAVAIAQDTLGYREELNFYSSKCIVCATGQSIGLIIKEGEQGEDKEEERRQERRRRRQKERNGGWRKK